MILDYNTIKKLLSKNILIENSNSQNIHSSSYDLTADKYILKFKKNDKPISFIDAQDLDNMYEEVNITEGYTIQPGETILIVLEEQFNMPNNICGTIRGRTSLNRLGLTLAIQHLNPGFKGKLNLTVTNNSSNSYVITPKIQIAQVIFEKMYKKVKKKYLYSNQSKAKYQNKDGKQGSNIYSDYIGKVVRHFKGNYYYIDDICTDSETKEYTIIYKNLYPREDSNVWARPAKMFFEEIDATRKDNITKQKHRFELANDLTIDYTKNNKKKDKKKN